jgi:serine/threonine protein kinase
MSRRVPTPLSALLEARERDLPVGIVSGRPIDWLTDPNRVGELGRGTYGVVEAYQVGKDGVLVAVKSVIDEYELTSGINGGLVVEMAFLSTLSHPNVVRLLDAFVGRDGMSLVLQLADGGTLDGALAAYRDEERELSLVERRSACFQLLRAVAYLHSRDVLHGDLKPSNVLVVRGGECGTDRYLLSDLGLASIARCSRRDARFASNAFSVWYRPVELLEGGDYTVAGDSWALGCVLYEVLTGGKVLLRGRDEGDQLRRAYALFGTAASDDGEAVPSTWQGVRDILTGRPVGGDRLVRGLLGLDSDRDGRLDPLSACDDPYLDDVRALVEGCIPAPLVQDTSCEEVLQSRVPAVVDVREGGIPLEVRSTLAGRLLAYEDVLLAADVVDRMRGLALYVLETVYGRLGGSIGSGSVGSVGGGIGSVGGGTATDVGAESVGRYSSALDASMLLASSAMTGSAYSEEKDNPELRKRAVEEVLALYGPDLLVTTSYDLLSDTLLSYDTSDSTLRDASTVLLRCSYFTSIGRYGAEVVSALCLILAVSFVSSKHGTERGRVLHARTTRRVGEERIRTALATYVSDLREVWVTGGTLGRTSERSRLLCQLGTRLSTREVLLSTPLLRPLVA